MSPRYGPYGHPLSRHNSFRTQSTINPATAQTSVDFPHPCLSSARNGAFEASSPRPRAPPPGVSGKRLARKPIRITRHILVERPAGFNAKIARTLIPASVRFVMSEARGAEGENGRARRAYRRAAVSNRWPPRSAHRSVVFPSGVRNIEIGRPPHADRGGPVRARRMPEGGSSTPIFRRSWLPRSSGWVRR